MAVSQKKRAKCPHNVATKLNERAISESICITYLHILPLTAQKVFHCTYNDTEMIYTDLFQNLSKFMRIITANNAYTCFFSKTFEIMVKHWIDLV